MTNCGTMNKWKLLVRQRLQDFLREFSNTCEKIGRKKNSVKIVFATKYLNREQFVAFLNTAREINMVPVTIGENRVQEAQAKFEFVKQTRPQLVGSFYPIMIGTLQKNKINKAINIFSEIHSVDSLDLARTLNKRLENIVILGSVSDSRITSSVNDSGQARMTWKISYVPQVIYIECNRSVKVQDYFLCTRNNCHQQKDGFIPSAKREYNRKTLSLCQIAMG